jgi:hypothetical protein
MSYLPYRLQTDTDGMCVDSASRTLPPASATEASRPSDADVRSCLECVLSTIGQCLGSRYGLEVATCCLKEGTNDHGSQAAMSRRKEPPQGDGRTCEYVSSVIPTLA